MPERSARGSEVQTLAVALRPPRQGFGIALAAFRRAAGASVSRALEWLTSIGYTAFAVATRLLGRPTPRGFTALIVVMVFMAGVQLLSMGVIGEYIARIYEEVKRRPTYLVARITSTAAHVVVLESVIQAPEKPGAYHLRVTAVQEGVAWFSDRGAKGLETAVDVVAVQPR